MGKALVRWALPTGVIGAAVLLNGHDLTIGVAIVVVCLTIALMFFIVAPAMRLIDRPMDRVIARRACDWLDGRRVGWSIPRLPAVGGDFRRLYQADNPKAPVAE